MQSRSHHWNWSGWQTGGYTGTGSTSYGSNTVGSDVEGRTCRTLISAKGYSLNRTCSAYTTSISGQVTCTGKSSLKGWVNTSRTATAYITVPARAQYAITYNANGGTLAAGTASFCSACGGNHKSFDYDCIISSAAPTREGFQFTGWNTAANGSGTSWAPGSRYTANAGMTLYAQWKVNSETYSRIDHEPASGISLSGFTSSDEGTFTYSQSLSDSEWFRILNVRKGARYTVTEEGTPQYRAGYSK